MSGLIKYRADIDGMRALAVMAVFIFHLNSEWLQGGFIGVDIFFVISGYLITRIILRELQQDTFSFWNFYARRVRRIFPVLFVVLAVCMLFAVLGMTSETYSIFFKSLRAAAGQISNFFFAHEIDYFDAAAELQPLLHTWSLAVEEQFYLMWPLLLYGCYRLWAGQHLLGLILVVMAGSFLLSMVLVGSHFPDVFYMFYSRAWEFCFGAIIALDILPKPQKTSTREAIGISGLLLLVGSLIAIDNKVAFSHGLMVLPCVGTMLLIYSAQTSQTMVSKLLSLKPVVAIGLISYSLYLWHWPTIVFYKHIANVEQVSLIASLVIIALSMGLARLSYRYVEVPTRGLKSVSFAPYRFIPSPHGQFIVAGVSLIIVVILLSNILKRYDYKEWRVAGTNKEYASMHELAKPCSFERSQETSIARCVVGDKKENYEVILFGDSHASHYFPVVAAWAQKHGLSARMTASPSCPPLFDSDGMRAGIMTKFCTPYQDYMQDLLMNSPHITHVFMGARISSYESDDYNAALENTVSMLSKKGIQVTFLGEVPQLQRSPNICVQRTLLGRWWRSDTAYASCGDIDANIVGEQAVYGQWIQGMVEKHGGHYFNPLPFIKRSITEEGVILYKDDNHLNKYGAEVLMMHLSQAP